MMTQCNYFVDYVDAILLDERASLTVDIIYEFLNTFFPKVCFGHKFPHSIIIIFNSRYPHMFCLNKL